MPKFYTVKEFADKVEWEGGVLEAIVYGLTEEDIPDDGTEHNKRLYQLWAEARTFQRIFEDIEEILDDYRRENE